MEDLGANGMIERNSFLGDQILGLDPRQLAIIHSVLKDANLEAVQGLVHVKLALGAECAVNPLELFTTVGRKLVEEALSGVRIADNGV